MTPTHLPDLHLVQRTALGQPGPAPQRWYGYAGPDCTEWEPHPRAGEEDMLIRTCDVYPPAIAAGTRSDLESDIRTALWAHEA